MLLGGEPLPIRPDAVPVMDGPNRQRLALIDLDDGRVARPADELDIAPQLLRWSPDSRRVLVWARRPGLD